MFDSVQRTFKRIFGDKNSREIKRIQPTVEKIRELESTMAAMSDERLAQQTAAFKQKLENGASLDDILPEVFATVREVSKRTMGLRQYDCQMIGGIVLHQGKISEMKTGEGKTLVGTAPIVLNALSGKGVHVITVNDYLAKRDAAWMTPIYRFLGLSVGVVVPDERSNAAKRAAYLSDITYGTNSEFGFDYLRDNMKFSMDEYVQRGHNFAIVDEVDSILIDEARTPLIISGPVNAPIEMYRTIDGVVPMLQREVDFTLDEKSRNITLTDEGITKVEQRLGIENLYDTANIETLHHVMQALKAHHLFKRDKDYVVREGEVIIVDPNTGRLMQGRRWSDGLHQAVEAKERVNVEPESQTYATITYQNYFRMYKKLAGMTGTAETEAAEFEAIYSLPTVVIPTNRELARLDLDDIVYKTEMEKFQSVIKDIRERHAKGQPILVGTTSVEKSHVLHQLLEREQIPHEVLNAKNHAREALIVAQAGRIGAITISTNMAGRGTDIKLGGNAEEMAKAELLEAGVDPTLEPERYAEIVKRHEVECAEEQKRVKAAGGLHIIGTERHESRRVDNQLRGRSGRQGDPGSSRFYLSLQDDLLRIFGSDKITIWMERMGLQDDEPIEHRWITSAIEGAQKKVEGVHFQYRKNLLEYDDVMNYQRKGVYELRRRALAREGVIDMAMEAVSQVCTDILDDYLSAGLHPEHWNLKAFRKDMDRVFGIKWPEKDAALRDFAREEIRKRLFDDAKAAVEAKREALGDDLFIEAARMFVLQITDQLWKDHLLAMDRLRQGVGLRGYGQRNPLLEYKKEAFEMYMLMSARRDELLLENIRNADAASILGLGRGNRRAAPPPPSFEGEPSGFGPAIEADEPPVVFEEEPPTPFVAPAKGAEARAFALANGVQRNDPCPCGSGLKFKKCCAGAESDGAEASA